MKTDEWGWADEAEWEGVQCRGWKRMKATGDRVGRQFDGLTVAAHAAAQGNPNPQLTVAVPINL